MSEQAKRYSIKKIFGPDVVARFNKYVRRSEGCWEWQGGRSSTGYGAFWFNGKTLGAHRISFAIHKGREALGLLVCHRCDNPRCVRPSHLFEGTVSDNAIDRDRKGRRKRLCGEDSVSSKLTNKQVLRIRERGPIDGVCITAARYRISPSVISEIVNRKAWRHL